MIDRAQFDLIKTKHGGYASWAVWADEGKKPKDNVGDLNIFDIDNNASLLHQLNPGIILVGLNISREVESRLANFHDARSKAMDYKIRYALKGSPFWGAYMTDIIKDFGQKVSGKMMSYLRNNNSFEDKNIEIFHEEMEDLRIDDPTIVAFGNDAFAILNRNFRNRFKMVKIRHYSDRISKENYREEVKSILGFK
jgi:hypothetical protein